MVQHSNSPAIDSAPGARPNDISYDISLMSPREPFSESSVASVSPPSQPFFAVESWSAGRAAAMDRV
eukprot:5030851-Prymnesium_polylepis.2